MSAAWRQLRRFFLLLEMGIQSDRTAAALSVTSPRMYHNGDGDMSHLPMRSDRTPCQPLRRGRLLTVYTDLI